MIIHLRLLISFILLLLSLQISAVEWRFIGDIEGLAKRFEQLSEQGIITKNAQGGWDLVEGKALSFEGDLWKRGPYGKRTVLWVQDLLTRYGDRVKLATGNHDWNTISLIQWMPKMEMGNLPEFNDYLKEKNVQNNLISRIQFWADRNGVNDKIGWFWLEEVADKLGVDPTDKAFMEKFYPNNKVNLDLLQTIIPKEKAYSDFFDFIKPDGPVWDLYKKSGVVNTWSSDGVKYLSWHSGHLSSANFGVVPGSTEDYFKLDSLKSMPPDKAKKEAALRLDRWATDYKKYVDSELSVIEKNFKTLKGNDGRAAISINPETLKKAETVYSSRLGFLGDAGWDPLLKKMNYEASSLVYPPPQMASDMTIAGLPEQKYIDFLSLAGVDYTANGHEPIGDLGVVQKAIPTTGKPIYMLRTDTSFSPIEQEDVISVNKGALHVSGKSRTGDNILLDLPSPKQLSGLRTEVAKYKALIPDEKAKLPALKAKKLEQISSQVEAYERQGLVANGWLVSGFETTTDPATGKTAQNLESYNLFRRDGRNMNYKPVDNWGIQSATLKPSTFNLSAMAANASKAKIEELKGHGKDVMDIKDLLRLIKDKNVMVTSGPADTSLTKALRNPDAAKMLQTHLAEFKTWLQNLPATEDWVFMGGGTHGFEEERNKLISEINQERIKTGKKPFTLVGLVTGVTGGAELDPNVKKYYDLNAFYWDDYEKEMLKVLDNNTHRPKKLIFDFAGGGGIVTKQITEVADYAKKYPDTHINFVQGLTPYTPKGIPTADEIKKMSATDAFIYSDQGKKLLTQKNIKIIPPEIGAMTSPIDSSVDTSAPKIFGRVLRGKTEQDFRTFSDDPSRKIVFFMDESSLSKVKNASGDSALLKLGYTQDYIDELHKNGTKFKMVTFEPKAKQVVSATWDNLMTLLEQSYPPEVVAKIKPHLEELKKTKFEDIEKMGTEKFSKIYSSGPSSTKYMTSAKLAALDKPSLWDVRAFLYNELRLSDLYSGDGFTHKEDGSKGIAEFIGINTDISKLQKVAVTDLGASASSNVSVAVKVPEAVVKAVSPQVSKDTLIASIDQKKPIKQMFIKDAPTLAYRIKSDRFEDLPEEIRKNIGSVDQTKYTKDYLKQNIGSVIALQMDGDKPDFYVIGKDTFDAKYASATLDDVVKKNSKYFGKVQGPLASVIGKKDGDLIAVLKTTPTDMIKMSDLGYDLKSEVTIESPWGAQTKPAGKDAFLVWDDSKKQYYMVNSGDNGLPLSYVNKPASVAPAKIPDVQAASTLLRIKCNPELYKKLLK